MIAVRAGTAPSRRRRALIVLLALVACGDDPTAIDPVCGVPPELVPGDVVMGRFEEGDARRASAYVHYYTVNLDGPAVARIEMTSSAVEPFLYLLDASARVIGQAFDPDPRPGPTTATLEALLGAGCYMVGASTWRTADTGAYTLTLEALPAGDGS